MTNWILTACAIIIVLCLILTPIFLLVALWAKWRTRVMARAALTARVHPVLDSRERDDF